MKWAAGQLAAHFFVTHLAVLGRERARSGRRLDPAVQLRLLLCT